MKIFKFYNLKYLYTARASFRYVTQKRKSVFRIVKSGITWQIGHCIGGNFNIHI